MEANSHWIRYTQLCQLTLVLGGWLCVCVCVCVGGGGGGGGGGYDNNGKVWYFRFDDDNKMSCKYIISIWLGQFDTYNRTYCEENKEGNRELATT